MARRSPNRERSGSEGRSRRGAAAKLKKPKKEKAKKKAKEKGGEDGKKAKVRAFARDFGEKERVALAVRDELYGGSWDEMREDLEARSEGRTYVFRLASRIEEDLKIIRKLSAFERRHDVDLAQYVEEG